MKIYLVLFTAMFVLTANSQTRNRENSLVEIVAAENTFADRAAESGTRAAFLEFAADSAVVFNLAPENAKQVWQKRPGGNALLAWRPAWADVSASGELGYTTGGWAFSRNKTDAPIGWGEYFTIWRKQADGSWKFMLDLGIQHDKAEVIANSWKSPEETAAKNKAKKISTDVWNTLENSFAESLNKKGAKKTYEKFSSRQIRLLREGLMPFQGKFAALAQIPDRANVTTKILGGGAASDLAYAFGEYELKTAVDGKIEKGFYARVWKREPRGWLIAVDVAHPLPPPAAVKN